MDSWTIESKKVPDSSLQSRPELKKEFCATLDVKKKPI